MRKILKETKGITLIALVLTIIILLILAGVTIATLTGDNGILSQAQNAKKVTEYATAEEKVKVEVMGSYGTNGNLELSKLVENLGHVGTVTKSTFPVEVTVDGKSFTISQTGLIEQAGPIPTVTGVTVTLENGNAVPEEKVEEGTALKINLVANIEGGTITSISPSVPYTTNGTEKSKTFTITGSADGKSYNIEYTVQLADYYIVINPEAGKNAITHNRTLAGKTDTSLMTYKNPVIPQGFSAIDTTDAKWEYTDENMNEVKDWNNGLVIQDNIGNEFVWVPCTNGESTSELVKYEKSSDYGWTNKMSDGDFGKTVDGVLYRAKPVYENNQIIKYGGFYVGRFEAGITNSVNDCSAGSNDTYSEIPVSKYGSRVWNCVNFEHAIVAARRMINDSEKYGDNISGLITATQWDTIMKWFEKSNIGVLNDNQNWGTYKDLDYSYSGNQQNSYYTVQANFATDGWKSGEFTHIGNQDAISDSNKAYYHASGLNANGYKKNIADLGGNLQEWTGETYQSYSSIYIVSRGGFATNAVVQQPASIRTGSSSSDNYKDRGFRVVIYIQ